MNRFRFAALLLPLAPFISLAQGPAPKALAYSAEEVQEFTQNLADGGVIHTEVHTKILRDSHGRVLRERGEIAVIYDPVADAAYILDLTKKTAQRFNFTYAAAAATPAAPGAITITKIDDGNGRSRYTSSINAALDSGREILPLLGRRMLTESTDINRVKEDAIMGFLRGGFPYGELPARPSSTSEDLGTQTIEGVSAHGHRTTTTYAPGSVGNDRELKTIVETWISDELHLPVRETRIDPRNGDRVTRLTKIDTSEPDIRFFRVPAGFKIR